MSWRDRDYNQADDVGSWSGGGLALPPASLTLMAAHGCAFLIMLMMHFDVGRDFALMFPLIGTASHPAAIVLHPFAVGGLNLHAILTLLLIGYAIWKLGAYVERRNGATKLLVMYVFGNLATGLAYFGLATAWPNLAGHPLDMPAGAFAAWCLYAWLRFNDDFVSIFGKMMTVGQAAGLAAAVIIGLGWVQFGFTAVVWMVAILAGALPAYVVDGLPQFARRVERTRVEPIPRRRLEPRRAEPEIDIDDILAKISRDGIDSLTDADRERLEAARRAKIGR